ncbi:hypothetical protein [Ferrimicrobium sp.]|uniref:hypothetical protein n=1 Tax=Ferrimicrobium sp. TaxID=2926050 RepID=UPI0026031238|nr:hypothetical protein [Ferrimicrobium sp.]
MDETYAAALRSLLVAQVEQTSIPTWSSARLKRWLTGAGVVLAALVAGGGIAYAAGVFSIPGGEVATPLATPVQRSGSGDQTVNLGRRPTGANAVTVDFTCLTAGRFVLSNGASLACNGPDPGPVIEQIPLATGQDSITISTSPGARWQLTATYAIVKTTLWSVNASHQTYGAINQNGTPDLVAVIGTNGRAGYVYASQLNAPAPTTTSQAIAGNHAPPRALNVYESNGKTVIGKFVVSTPVPIANTTPN